MKKGNSKKTNGKLKLIIVGPGVVGQAQGKAFALHGYDTSFIGGNSEKTERLKKEGYKAYSREDLFDGSYDYDVSFLTVPTPTVNRQIKLGAIKNASADLGKRLKARKNQKYHLVVVKSTVPPGTTEELVIKNVEESSGLKAGKDFGVCMNPEYLREATALEDALKPWVILIGELDQRSGDILAQIYSKFDCPLYRCSLKEAEMQKYVHNLYNATKITFFNEMREVAEQIGISPNEIFEVTEISAEGMWNPKYGTKDYGPFNGSCLPKDTQAFYEWASKKGIDVSLLEKVIHVNDSYLQKYGDKEEPIEIGSNL